MRYLPRALATTVRRAMRSFPAVLITGARQTGKTTLLQQEFGESHRYVSLERPDVRARAEADPVSFLAELPARVILDEIQYAPDLLHYIKENIDADRRPGRWLLTGSQTFPLMHGVSQSLAGRVAVVGLEPLSVSEIVAGGRGEESVDVLLDRVFRGSSERQRAGGMAGPDEARPGAHAIDPTLDLVDWLLRGGYPEPRLNPEVDRRIWFGSYVQTYLERDVRDLLQVGDLAVFNRFLALVAARTGTVVNMSELGREVGVTGPTAKRWLSVLETSRVVYLLRPYFRNYGKRIRKSPKLYLLDAGLAAFLQGLHEREALLGGPTLGALAETAVVSEWIKAFRQRGEEPEIYFWRSASGLEVDLLMPQGGKLYGVEVKATATPRPAHADSLAKWMELAGPDTKGVLACRVDARTPLRDGIAAVPWHLAWSG